MAEAPRGGNRRRPAAGGKGARKPPTSTSARAPKAPAGAPRKAGPPSRANLSTTRPAAPASRRPPGSRRETETGRRRDWEKQAVPGRVESRDRQAPPEYRKGGKWFELVLALVQAPVGLAQSQTERLIAELVRTGDMGYREAERLLGEIRSAGERAQGRAAQETSRIDRFIEGRIEDVLKSINIPSRSDIERLNSSVEVLTNKVEALLSRQAGGPSR